MKITSYLFKFWKIFVFQSCTWETIRILGSIYFYVAGVFKGNYFSVPVYNDVLGPAAACPVVWGFPHYSCGLDLTFFISVGLLSLWHIQHIIPGKFIKSSSDNLFFFLWRLYETSTMVIILEFSVAVSPMQLQNKRISYK